MGRIQRLGMIVAFIVIIISAYIGVKTVFVEEGNSVVPNLVGMQLAEAVDTLQKEGLLAKVDRVDSALRADTVVSQNIQPGDRTSRGKVVIIRVSKGGAVMPIPDVRGLNFEEGVKRLSDAGFKVNKVMRVTDSLKSAGTIIAQNPAAPQQVSASCMVSLLVSTGTGDGSSNFASIPDLRGQTADAAKDILEQSGLKLGKISKAPSVSMPPGSILGSKPRQGARMPVGSTVNITIARTPTEGELTQDAPPKEPTEPLKTEPVRTVVIESGGDAPAPAVDPSEVSEQAPAQQEPASEPEPEPEPKSAPAPPPGTKMKTAKVRYQVPPLSKPLSLKIEMTDGMGMKVLKDTMAKSGEYVSIDVPFVEQATITIYLGGDFVWQDRFN